MGHQRVKRRHTDQHEGGDSSTQKVGERKIEGVAKDKEECYIVLQEDKGESIAERLRNEKTVQRLDKWLYHNSGV